MRRTSMGLLMSVALVPGLARAATDCAVLADTQVEDANVLSASVVPAAGGLPGYCRVLGYVRPAVNFEVRMPIGSWNGKFYMAGCGGFCGKLLAEGAAFANGINYGLVRGYAVATMDSGHWGEAVDDARWAWNNRVAEVDWGYRAVHETARVAKVLVDRFYGAPGSGSTVIKRSYFAGCSTGGRMALMEAQRFPADFDGIIAGAPALDYTGLVGTLFPWLVQANTGRDGKQILAREKVSTLVQPAVLRACDAKDGASDGVIADPTRCDPTAVSKALPRCQSTAGDQCLTPAELEVLRKWYAGPTDGHGKRLYADGIPFGSEAFWPSWLSGIPATSPTGPLVRPFNTRMAESFLRYMAFANDPGEAYEVSQYDFLRDPQRLAAMAAVYNATDPNLRPFSEGGRKLLIYHGWADAVVTPLRTLQYFRSVESALGGAGPTRDVVRLFMVPGYDHCGVQRNAASGIEDRGHDGLLDALERWVEQGQAPDSVTLTGKAANGKEWSQLLCPFPQVIDHTGRGCTDP